MALPLSGRVPSVMGGTVRIMESKARESVTIVIPARNEERGIAELISLCRPHGDEVLVVDGRSRDETARRAMEAGARVVTDGGGGKGDGVRTGINEAAGDFIVFIDADFSHIPDDIPRLLAPLRDGTADLVLGSRAAGGSDEFMGTIDRFFRFTGSHLLLLAVNYYHGVLLTDIQNGFRAVRRDVALKLQLRENSHAVEEEMVMKCLKARHRIIEVPTHEQRRRYGASTLHLSRDWYRFIWCLIRNL